VTEETLVAAIREITASTATAKLRLGIGDDAAAWQPSRSHLSVITTDALIEDVHFTRSAMSAADVGHRALAANLSDIAAMGARPVLATVAFGVSSAIDEEWVRDFYRGLAGLAARTGTAIAGGDIVRAPVVSISITVVGEVRRSSMKTRAGALAGDVVAVTGPLGASRAGCEILLDRPDLASEAVFAETLQAYRTPEPRLREGRFLGASRNVHAMMDTSDGIASDLARLCAASNLGSTLDTLPVSVTVETYCKRLGLDAQTFAIEAGEDFELLLAIDRRAFPYLAARFRAHTGRELIGIGEITAEPGLRLRGGTALNARGYDHLTPR
jgi:thiamine-monophosphate kinase